MSDGIIIWDLPDDPDGNVQHIAAHDITTEEVEDVLLDRDSDDTTSRWKLLTYGMVTLSQFGGLADDSTENATPLSNALAWCGANGDRLCIDDEKGVHKVSSAVIVTDTRITLYGHGTLKFYASGCLQVGDASNNAILFLKTT